MRGLLSCQMYIWSRLTALTWLLNSYSCITGSVCSASAKATMLRITGSPAWSSNPVSFRPKRTHEQKDPINYGFRNHHCLGLWNHNVGSLCLCGPWGPRYGTKYVCKYACVHVCTYVGMYACTYACMYVCTQVCVYKNIYMYIYIYMCVCMCVCGPFCISPVALSQVGGEVSERRL